MISMNDLLEKTMAQKQPRFATEAPPACYKLPDEAACGDDSVTPAAMALVRERAAVVLQGRVLRSLSEPG